VNCFRRFHLIICFVILGFPPGCGSGGGGNGSGAPTNAIIHLSTQGTPSSQPLYGVQVTLSLPAGVTVAANASGTTNDGVVTASGAAAGASTVITGHYASSVGTVQIDVAKATGFGTGQFATVACTVTKGYSPKAADFGTSNFKAVDENGAEITGLSIAYSVDLN
jgi:hypothetical protein